MAEITSSNVQKFKYGLDEAITMAGFGAFNFYIFFTIGGFLMCVIIETMSMMFIVPAAKCDLELSLMQQGLLSSISFFGVVATSHAWAFIADTRGRKNVLIISLITSFITSMFCSLIEDSWLFILLRFVNGGCIGGASSIVYAYLGEFHNDKIRPKIVSGVATFVALGNMYLPGMAWLILPQKWELDITFLGPELIRPWRLLMIIYAIPSIIFALMLCVLPESPKFLLTKGKYSEVLEILKTMFHYNTGLSKEEYAVSEIIWEDLGLPKTDNFLKTLWKQTVPLFRHPMLMKTLGVSVLQFGIFASTSGMLMWYPSLLNTMSHFVEKRPDDVLTLCNSVSWEKSELNLTQSEENQIECNDHVKTEVFMVSLVIGFGYACMYVIIGLVINVFGKKNILCLFIIVGTTAGLISQYVEGYQLIQILVGIFVVGGVEVSIVNTIVVDLFPTQVRAMALAMSLMFGRLGAMVGTNLVGPLIFNWCEYLFYVFTVNSIVLLLIISLLPSSKRLSKMVDTNKVAPETKA